MFGFWKTYAAHSLRFRFTSQPAGVESSWLEASAHWAKKLQHQVSTRWEGKDITRNKRGSACSVALVTYRPAQVVAEVFKHTVSNILIIHVPYSSEKSSTSTEQGTISTHLAASVCKATEQKLIQELPMLQFLLVPIAVLYKTADDCADEACRLSDHAFADEQFCGLGSHSRNTLPSFSHKQLFCEF